MKTRKEVLLRAAYDLLKRADDSPYVMDPLGIPTRFDNANCDGHCLMEDIKHELGLEEGTEPIELEPEEQ